MMSRRQRRTVVKYRTMGDNWFHLKMTTMTLGMWSMVWGPVAIWRAFGPRRTIRIWEDR
jgi:hypothetical protein